MNYLLKSKPKSTNRSKIIAVIFLYIFLSLLGFLFGDAWRRMVWSFSRPVWATRSFIVVPFANIKNYFVFKNTLVERNLTLEEENLSLRLKEADYDLVIKENQDLKTELGREPSGPRTVSYVLSKPPRSPYDTLVVDVGSEEGITPGSKVFVGGNVIVGLITNITPHTSLVNMFSGGGQKQDGILSRTGATFTLIGKGGQNFEIEVPRDSDILWGDIFTYPGISNSILASVYYIDDDSQSSFKTIYLRIPVNVFSSKQVFVGQ